MLSLSGCFEDGLLLAYVFPSVLCFRLDLSFHVKVFVTLILDDPASGRLSRSHFGFLSMT